MLNVFREGAKTWVSRVLVWLIAMTFVGAAFVVWGQKGAQTAASAAVVGGEEISRGAIYQRAKAIENTLRQQLGDQFNAELMRSLNPKAMALDALIEEALTRKAAEEAGLGVSEDEIRDTIMGMKEFLTDGVFDRRKYQDILAANGYSTADFERNVGHGLLSAKFKTVIQRPVRVSDAEALEAYLKDKLELVTEYVDIPEAAMRKDVKPTEAELKEWHAARQTEFEQPSRRAMRILQANVAAFELSSRVTEEEARKYFDTHQNEFQAVESAEASQILARVTPGAPESVDKAAKEKIEKTLGRVKAGEDFAKLAGEVSDDPSSANGGSLGRFTRGQMVDAIDQAVFSMKAGEVSGPIKTPFGWHIVKVTNRIEAGAPEWSLSRDLATLKAKKAKAAEDAKAAIMTALEGMTVQNFEEKSKTNSHLRSETLVLSRNDHIPDIDDSERLMDKLFAMEKGTISGVIELPENYVILALDEVVPARTPTLEEIRPMAVERYTAEKARQLAKETAEKLEREIQGGKSMAAAAQALGLAVKTTPPFSQGSLRSGGGAKEAGMSPDAFLLADGQAKAAPGPGGYAVIKVKERRPVDWSKAAVEIESARANLLAMKRERVLADFVRRLRKMAEERKEIVIYDKVGEA